MPIDKKTDMTKLFAIFRTLLKTEGLLMVRNRHNKCSFSTKNPAHHPQEATISFFSLTSDDDNVQIIPGEFEVETTDVQGNLST
jgi:hypothetical protein